MKTIQLELSDSIYDRVLSFLKQLPKNECNIVENLAMVASADAENEANDIAGSLKSYATTYIPTSKAKQQAWQAISDEKYNRS